MDKMQMQSMAQQVQENSKLFLRRTFKSDFQKEQASLFEREMLRTARRPILDPLAQDYVAWRRAILWVATVALGVHAIVGLIHWIDELTNTTVDQLNQYADGASAAWKWMRSLIYFRVPIATIFLGLAALNWTEVRKSRHWARQSWMVLVFTPVVLSVVPWTSFVDLPAQAAGQQAMMAKMGLGVVFGGALMITIAPLIIGLMTGVMRSSMALKTLLPESPAPGWACIMACPVDILVLIAMMVIVMQMTGTVMLMLGLAGLIAAPLLYLVGAKTLIQPYTGEEVKSRIAPIRAKATLAALAGAILLLIFAKDQMKVEWLTVCDLVSNYIASALTFSLVGSDFLLALMFHAHKQSKNFHGTPLASALETKYAALESVGLLKLQTESKTTFMQMPEVGPKS